MSLGLRDERRRRRRRFRWALFRWLLALAAIGGAGAFAYRQGTALAERGVAAREEQVRVLAAQVDELREAAGAQAAEAAAERARTEEWRQRYEQDVTRGETRELLELLQSKLAKGVDAARLRWVLERTEERRNCDPRSPSKRIQVETPISGGRRATASFGDIAVGIMGASARNASGAPEAWYDPTQPVTVTITPRDGQPVTTDGTLPLNHSMLEAGREYRIAITAVARGLAQITVERCRFP